MLGMPEVDLGVHQRGPREIPFLALWLQEWITLI